MREVSEDVAHFKAKASDHRGNIRFDPARDPETDIQWPLERAARSESDQSEERNQSLKQRQPSGKEKSTGGESPVKPREKKQLNRTYEDRPVMDVAQSQPIADTMVSWSRSDADGPRALRHSTMKPDRLR